MKRMFTLKSGSFAFLLMTICLSVSAKDDVIVCNYRETDYVIISAVLERYQDFRIIIKDDNHGWLYRSPKIINTNVFQRLVDLKSMPDGVYHVSVQADETTELKTFEIRNHQLVQKNSISTASNVDFLMKDSEMLYVRQVNPDKASTRMDIVNENGQVIYSNELPSKEVYNGIFKLSGLPKGKYVVSVASGDQNHQYEFSK